MAYTDLLEEEGVNAQYLCILRPSRRVTSFTLHSGSVYYSDFSYGYVYSIYVDGVALTLGASATLSAGEYYYDHGSSRLYVRKSNSSAPSASDFIIVTYELHIGTLDAHWYRIPTDTSTEVVYFDPYISNVPEVKSNVTDLLFGLLPVQSTGIALNNAEHWAEKHIYDSSFKDKEILVYHWLDDLTDANIKLVLRGRMADVSYNYGSLQIKILDDTNIFDKEFRSAGTYAFFNTTGYANCDPQFIGKPIRTVYGRVDGFVPVNVSYVREGATTSNNRTWVVRAEGANSHAVTRTVPASPASTNTRTYVDSITGLSVGDSVWIDKTTDEYRFVTAIGANYIEHDALSSGAASTGNTVKRGTVGYIDIIQNQTRYRAHYNRDWTESNDANGSLAFTFSTSLESNLSMASTLSTSDQLNCRVYGKTNNITLGGPSFGTNSTAYGNLTNITVILLDILKRYVGLAEGSINTTSFTSLLSAATDEIGFAVPDKASGNFPQLKKLIVSILESSFLKLYLDFDMKWKATQYEPISSTTKTITEDEILSGSISYDFDYSDVYSDFVVEYARKERDETGTDITNKVTAVNNLAKYLHGINKTFETDSLHIDSSGAQTLCNRLSYVLGDRNGEFNLSTKNRFFNNIVDDGIEVTLQKLPGNAYDGTTEYSRNLQITKIEKSLRQVKLTLSDQKGAQDNSGSW